MSFATMDEYTAAQKCPQCGASPGQPCDGRKRFHAKRQDAGNRHYQRDVGNAPWPEDREPGRSYSTLS